MRHQFRKHFDLAEARALLPAIRRWFQEIWNRSEALQSCETRLEGLVPTGLDRGGDLVNEWTRNLIHLQSTLNQFNRRGILVKDLNRGLIDFPAVRGDKEILLCWEMGEEDIEHWHDLDSGYSGREPL